MAKVVWGRREDIKKALKTIAPRISSRARDFRPPPTLESDFKRQLEHDVPNVNYTFELVRDWYKINDEDYEPVYLRGQQTPIDWKSKIGNSDMNTNLKVTHEIPIYKGDMVIREDGYVFLMVWNIQNHANNQATQIGECNAQIEIVRHVPDEVDSNGMLVTPGGDRVVVPMIPIIHSTYAGRPDYSDAQGTPGIHADNLITVQVQWNEKTKGIHINDTFVIGPYTYSVVSTSIEEVNIDREYGVFTFNAKRVAGGGIVNEKM